MTDSLKFDWTKISHDTNGNPRYVVHFVNIHKDYDTAVKICNKLGGKRYHNKQYGGGIVFQSYNLESTERRILEAIGK